MSTPNEPLDCQRTDSVAGIAQASQELTNARPDIQKADGELIKSLKSVQQSTDVINQTTELLEYVDQAIDLAKDTCPDLTQLTNQNQQFCS